LLNIALGNHDDVVAVGELCNVQRDILSQDNWCSCGVLVDRCQFWRQVHSHLNWVEPETLRDLRARFESSRAAVTWPWFGGRATDAIKAYQTHLLDVLQSVRRVSGRSLVVDASKLPGRAMALAMMPEVELYLVHLVRDVRALVWARSMSWKQDLRRGIEADVPARSTAHVCFHWCKANWLSSLVRRRVPPERSLRLRYEDFVSDPSLALRRIGAMLRMDFASVAVTLQTGRSLCKGHTASGNRMRMSDVRLKPDFDWIDRLSPKSQAMAWLLTSHQLRRYGYQRPCRDASGIGGGASPLLPIV
jgi:hypothetical protein